MPGDGSRPGRRSGTGPAARAPVRLRDGSVTGDARADRIEQADARSTGYPVAAALPARPPRSYTWRLRTVLDQGGDGACVGFAWAHYLLGRPLELSGIDADYARDRIYLPAQRVDRFPGGEYPGAVPLMAGTSVLAGARVVRAAGLIREYLWAGNVAELLAAVAWLGPAVIGCGLHRGMLSPDRWGWVRPTGARVGKHAYVLRGLRMLPTGSGDAWDTDRSWALLQNSFGPSWGRGGACRITVADLARLWPGTEACIPIAGRRAGRPRSSRS
jgi:hypothetical protein